MPSIIDNNNHTSCHYPCSILKGVGPKLAKTLAKKGIQTVQELLFHLPLRYQDRTRITSLRDIRLGDHAVIEGIVKSCRINHGRRASLICELEDSGGTVLLRFFHFTMNQKAQLTPGSLLRCYGEIRRGRFGYEMVHPEYTRIQAGQALKVEETLTPIYPTTDGLSQLQLKKLTSQALQLSRQGTLLQEYLPQEILVMVNLPSLAAAVHYVHRPPPEAEQKILQKGRHPMQQRLAFEELLAHNIALQRLRQLTQRYVATPLFAQGALSQQFLTNLPFTLTNAQKKVVKEIYSDIEKTLPMLRLVQGDVGSGKTLVAALAMLRSAEMNLQSVLMAPTEILAEQHCANFKRWFEPLGIEVAWLSGKLKAKAKREALSAIASGKALVIIGTHALFQHQVDFASLSLVVIDEQHRFGVHQRLALREKGQQSGVMPHQLIMTATPIPRSLAMTAYADLDYSVIDEMPPGRMPITTIVLGNKRRAEVIERLLTVCQQGQQVYWVCTLIEESEVMQCQAAEVTAQDLQQQLPMLKVGLVHGRMGQEEKEAVMQGFTLGEINLLVATTVIEVGVDVPNATLMIIENPERLGLAQLHQLRGRVGRGDSASFCVLLYQEPLGEYARQRLTVMRETNNGFDIAQRDLEQRGPGEVLGTRQTGDMRFRIANIIRDQQLLPQVKKTAMIMIKKYPEQCRSLEKRWLAERIDYSQV